MTWNRHLAVFAALNGAMAVAVGAFAAHGAGPQVKSLLTTGASYQLAHALLGLVCAHQGHRRGLAWSGWIATAGGTVFCLALASLAFGAPAVLGAVAPIGGLMMIGGWLGVAITAARSPSVNL